MSSEMAVNSPRWYAIHTHPKQEDRADSNLNAWRVETFYPKIREHRRHPYTGDSVSHVKPLFPRYIFARFDAGRLLHKVSFTRGVNSVVSCDYRPAPVEDDTIDLIRSRLGADGLVRIDDELRKGDEVTVRKGPLQGLKGVFERSLKDSDRVVILLRTIGSTTISYQSNVIINREFIKKNAPEGRLG